MHTKRVIYWTTTILFSVTMLTSAYLYLTSPAMAADFKHLGFPSYFRIELAIAKILGVATLLLPFAPTAFKDFAYAGFTIVLFSAAIAHSSIGDPAIGVIMSFVLFAILSVSYIYYGKLVRNKADA